MDPIDVPAATSLLRRYENFDGLLCACVAATGRGRRVRLRRARGVEDAEVDVWPLLERVFEGEFGEVDRGVPLGIGLRISQNDRRRTCPRRALLRGEKTAAAPIQPRVPFLRDGIEGYPCPAGTSAREAQIWLRATRSALRVEGRCPTPDLPGAVKDSMGAPLDLVKRVELGTEPRMQCGLLTEFEPLLVLAADRHEVAIRV